VPLSDDVMDYINDHPLHVPFKDTLFSGQPIVHDSFNSDSVVPPPRCYQPCTKTTTTTACVKWSGHLDENGRHIKPKVITFARDSRSGTVLPLHQATSPAVNSNSEPTSHCNAVAQTFDCARTVNHNAEVQSCDSVSTACVHRAGEKAKRSKRKRNAIMQDDDSSRKFSTNVLS
jgi:hypothetical protein